MVIDKGIVEPTPELAKKALEQYDLKVDGFDLIEKSEKKKKAVWRVATSAGPMCLKRLPHGLDRTLFSLGAQDYMAARGGPVPRILRNRQSRIYTEIDGDFFAVYDWLPGRHPGGGQEHYQSLRVLADFHRSSRGYAPPEGARVSTKLGAWPRQYEDMCRKFEMWSEAASDRSESSDWQEAVRAVVDQGRRAVDLLATHGYERAIDEFQRQPGLCHQDFGQTNVLISSQGAYVIDFDGITFDVAARDLRKFINKQNGFGWDGDVLKKTLAEYEAVNPLGPHGRRLLLIDLYFPHIFYAEVKKPFRENSGVSRDFGRQMVRIAKLELARAAWLSRELAS